MDRGKTAMALGIAAAAAVGTAAYAMNRKQHSRSLRHIKKDAQKTLRTVEGVIEGVASMIG